jgi:hypothetical protein
MAITPMTDSLDIIAALADTPNDTSGLTAAQLKAKFDEAGNTIKEYINDTMIPSITAQIGAAEMHDGNVPSGGTTGQALMKTSDTDYDAYWSSGISAATPSTVMGRDANGNASVATPTDEGHVANKAYVGSMATAVRGESLARDLGIMLNLALATSNIDAWADILADATRINAATSSGYTITGGALYPKITNDGGAVYLNIGYNAGSDKAGQTFAFSATGEIRNVRVTLKKTGSPTDNITMGIFATSGGLPTGTALYTSTTVLAASTVGSNTAHDFAFAGANTNAGTMYAFVLARSGSYDPTNYISVVYNSSGAYAAGTGVRLASGTWEIFSAGADLGFELAGYPATVIWNAVTATEALQTVAVAADLTLGTGTATFYMSDDGTAWTQITALNTAQSVTFDATSVYLKCVLTYNAVLNGVAWGGC